MAFCFALVWGGLGGHSYVDTLFIGISGIMGDIGFKLHKIKGRGEFEQSMPERV